MIREQFRTSLILFTFLAKIILEAWGKCREIYVSLDSDFVPALVIVFEKQCFYFVV